MMELNKELKEKNSGLKLHGDGTKYKVIRDSLLIRKKIKIYFVKVLNYDWSGF